ncbi:hypothetical protein ACI5KX_00315 [Erythrobacter sp. GH1-10]|uniref:hypothetical protein n=1 Tax=Erythrobacter sp. GH1-10 TaxID=3349334 RepID=UPI003877B827
MPDSPIAFPAAAVLALAVAACSGEEEQKTYEVGAEDVGGGELIAREADPDEVEVDLPETPMTPVPEGDAESEAVTNGETE